MHKIVITGGAGFIGSHVVEKFAEEYPDTQIIILDKMTYAADIDNIAHVLKRGIRHLQVGDICDYELCMKVTKGADLVLHLAAESHVDNSFGNSLRFTTSNTLGTHTLLEACRHNDVRRIIHVSTDEVYGEISQGFHKEGDVLDPTNPYSASKAAGDMIVNSFIHCFKMPIIIVRANNIYGIRQYPEKIIPRFCMQALSGQKFTLHGNGRNCRRFLSARDFADALGILVLNGELHNIYNIGSDEEYTNLDIAKLISSEYNIPYADNIVFVNDRPFNDCRYAIDCSKLSKLGWGTKRSLKNDISMMTQWYRQNAYRYEGLFSA